MFVKVTKNEKPLGIPYFRPPDDTNSHSFVDLRQHPEQIALIPEIRDWPELEATLIDLRKPGSAFRSHGCEKQFCEDGSGHGVSGYVGVWFDDISRAKSLEAHAEFFDRFQKEALTGWPDTDTFVEFEVQPTILREENATIWSFSIWLIVRGCASQEAAKEKWSAALKFVREFLTGQRYET